MNEKKQCTCCESEMIEGEYLSPMYVDGSLLPACILWTCPDCPNYEYHDTEYRGERLYSYAQVS